MECTQRLECTQELYATQTKGLNPEQIGFLGICGTTYPVKMGLNKIGRDPATCSIVLNLNSISRQHALINVLSDKEFMLMDLASSNKTKVLEKTLRPYTPHPIKNGDTVQFGDVFGIFRLLHEDTDLPMTQAIDIPDTPVFARHASRLGKAPVTTIPESPDVSDRDDSFIVPSQPKGNHQFKSPSNKYIKQSAKTISIQPIGSHKIDNVYWNSSKKSSSMTLCESSSSLNDSAISVESDSNCNQNNDVDIHEMETQPPFSGNNESSDSIYTAATQVPNECKELTSIDSLDTQFPVASAHVPVVCKIANQPEMQFDLFTANKENENSIFNAETQLFEKDKSINQDSCNNNVFTADTQMPTVDNNIAAKDQDNDRSIFNAETQPPAIQNMVKKSFETASNSQNKSKTKLNVSDEEILFDEVDSECFEDVFDSQPLLPPETSPAKNVDISLKETKKSDNEKIEASLLKRKIRTKSDSSTDCEDVDDIDIVPSQVIPKENDDDVTDCEDDLFEDETGNRTKPSILPTDTPTVKFEDMLTQQIKEDASIKAINKKPNNLTTDSPTVKFEDIPTKQIKEDASIKEINKKQNNFAADSSKVSFEDMQTQVIEEDVSAIPRNNAIAMPVVDPLFEDMPTQVLQEDNIRNEADLANLATQIIIDEAVPKTTNDDEGQQQYSEEIISPFKVPLQTPLKMKKRDIQKLSDPKPVKLEASEIKISSTIEEDDDKYYAATQDLFEDLCSQRESSPEVVKVLKIKTPNHTIDRKELSPKQKHVVSDNSSGSSDGNEKINNFVKSLTNTQIRDVVGVDPPVEKLKRQPSDLSDVESTPKKMRSFNLLQTDLPNSQEIKCSVSLVSKSLITESSSESEVDEDSQEGTPILFRRKKRPKTGAKIDLTKKFDSKALPTRIITRVRKPTFKIQNGVEENIKISKSILKPIFLTEQDEDVDTEIITENISRLKSNVEKKHNRSPKGLVPDYVKIEDRVSPKTNITEAPAPNNKKLEVKTKQKRKDKESDKSDHKSRRTRKNENNKDKEAKTVSKKESTVPKTAEAILSTSSRRYDESLNSTTETNRNSRSTRSSRNRSKNDNNNEKTSVSPEKDSAPKRRGRPKHAEKAEEKNESSPKREIKRETRRSKRQKAMENSLNTIEAGNKRNNPSDNHSTVYGISSESDVNSPSSLKRLKRRALDEAETPSSKRTRSVVASNSSTTLRRSTPALPPRTQHVLFTAFPSEEVKSKLEKLGAVIVSDVSACSVVLTLQIKRTFKLLCAAGLGRPIVGPAWVQACVDSGTLVDPWLYILKDSATEARFHFSLQRTLTGPRNFLKGYNVSSTPSVMPRAEEMKVIVECSGGSWGARARAPRWLCVSCGADRALWPALARRGAALVSSELVLSGALRQVLDVEANRLR